MFGKIVASVLSAHEISCRLALDTGELLRNTSQQRLWVAGGSITCGKKTEI